MPNRMPPGPADSATTRTRTGVPAGGSGLGLAVAAAITTAHGGRLGVRSTPGRTEFTLELPVSGPPSTGTAGRARPASVEGVCRAGADTGR